MKKADIDLVCTKFADKVVANITIDGQSIPDRHERLARRLSRAVILEYVNQIEASDLDAKDNHFLHGSLYIINIFLALMIKLEAKPTAMVRHIENMLNVVNDLLK